MNTKSNFLHKIEKTVLSTYSTIEGTVLFTYFKTEEFFVTGYQKTESFFINTVVPFKKIQTHVTNLKKMNYGQLHALENKPMICK